MSTTSTLPPDPTDFLDVDGFLDEDERAIRNVVREYARAELAPHIADWYEDGATPARDLAKGLGAIGLLGMHLRGYNCVGTSAIGYGVACRELEAVDSGMRGFVSLQGSLAMFAIYHWGSEEQQRRWLPSMAAGEAIGCFGLTEADAGSDPGAMRTTARRQGRDWVLNGTKMSIINGTIADIAVVWAGIEDGIRGFVYMLEPEKSGKPLAAFQRTQRTLADLVITVNNASLVALRIAAQVSYGKLANVRAALDVARTARGMLGAAGITLEHPVTRHMVNLETVTTYGGTEEMHTLSLRKVLTGIAAFR